MAQTLQDVRDAFWAYEAALMADDVDGLDFWFLDAAHTLRADAQGVLVGATAIAAYRRGRSGRAPRRLVDRLHVTEIATGCVVVVAELRRLDGGRGIQTQVWVQTTEGWRVASAHVSSAAPDSDPVWRLHGTPLVAGSGAGPLTGMDVAVKDLYAVAGYRTGAGVPAWLAEAPVEAASAPAVQLLLDAGADVVGIAQTDELAYSLSGTNAHYGTPPNPRAPGCVPGGSSSGPASAVALGDADVGLATDTAGSVRVPASYLGLYALRPTHGVVDNNGVVALAPRFDTVGWITRDARTLATVGDVLLPPATSEPVLRALLGSDLLALASPEVADACRSAARRLGIELLDVAELCRGMLDAWCTALRIVQGFQAHRTHGDWVRAHPGALGPGIAERFATAARVTERDAQAAETVLADARSVLHELLPAQTVLVLPASSTSAPPCEQDTDAKDAMRASTLRLTCLASLAGFPAVVMPTTATAIPVGLCAIGGPGTDRSLLALAQTYESSFR